MCTLSAHRRGLPKNDLDATVLVGGQNAVYLIDTILTQDGTSTTTSDIWNGRRGDSKEEGNGFVECGVHVHVLLSVTRAPGRRVTRLLVTGAQGKGTPALSAHITLFTLADVRDYDAGLTPDRNVLHFTC